MKIILSETFVNKYLNKFSKYFSKEIFVKKLKENNKNITLKFPHFKIKLKIKSVDFRWVILIKNWDYLIPILICLKKDKNCWENIIWKKFEKIILELEDKTLKDIENKKYEIFE